MQHWNFSIQRALFMLGLLFACSSTVQAGGDPAVGKAKSEVCAGCHGADGNQPTAPMYPILAGQHANYLSHALHDYKSGKRKNPVMAGFAGALSDQDIADLAAYFSRQNGKLKVLPQ